MCSSQRQIKTEWYAKEDIPSSPASFSSFSFYLGRLRVSKRIKFGAQIDSWICLWMFPQTGGSVQKEPVFVLLFRTSSLNQIKVSKWISPCTITCTMWCSLERFLHVVCSLLSQTCTFVWSRLLLLLSPDTSRVSSKVIVFIRMSDGQFS